MIGTGLPLPGLAPASAPQPAASAADTGRPTATSSAAAGAQDTPAAGSADREPSRFDRMLDEGATEPTAGSTAPAEAETGSAERKDEPSDTPSDLPNRMLSLLASLAMPVPAPATTPTASTPAADVLMAGTPGLPRPAFGPTPATPPAQAGALHAGEPAALPAVAATADTAAAFALPALAGGRDRGAAPSGDVLGALSDLAPLSGTAAGAPALAARDTVAVPVAPQVVAMPADPQAGLDDAFGANLMWMSDQKIGQAEIRVTPDHLGPIDVRLHLDGTKVRAEFLSAQPDVRQAIESGMGRLRDMLGQQGLQLAQADVGQRQSQSRDGASTDAATGREDRDEPVVTPAVVRMQRGLLDTYA